MRGIILGFALAALSVGPTRAQSAVGVEIVEYGVYTAEVTGAQRESSGVQHSFLGDIRHAATTTTVPAQRGVRFGFRYRVTGAPAGQQVDLRKVTIFPPPGLKSPKDQRTVQSNEYLVHPKIGETSYTGYSLDDPWELVPGRWTLQLWQGNRKLVEQFFNIVVQQ